MPTHTPVLNKNPPDWGKVLVDGQCAYNSNQTMMDHVERRQESHPHVEQRAECECPLNHGPNWCGLTTPTCSPVLNKIKKTATRHNGAPCADDVTVPRVGLPPNVSVQERVLASHFPQRKEMGVRERREAPDFSTGSSRYSCERLQLPNPCLRRRQLEMAVGPEPSRLDETGLLRCRFHVTSASEDARFSSTRTPSTPRLKSSLFTIKIPGAICLLK